MPSSRSTSPEDGCVHVPYSSLCLHAPDKRYRYFDVVIAPGDHGSESAVLDGKRHEYIQTDTSRCCARAIRRLIGPSAWLAKLGKRGIKNARTGLSCTIGIEACTARSQSREVQHFAAKSADIPAARITVLWCVWDRAINSREHRGLGVGFRV